MFNWSLHCSHGAPRVVISQSAEGLTVPREVWGLSLVFFMGISAEKNQILWSKADLASLQLQETFSHACARKHFIWFIYLPCRCLPLSLSAWAGFFFYNSDLSKQSGQWTLAHNSSWS